MFDPDYLEGKPFNLSATVASLASESDFLPSLDPRTTEDCLFLDVVVPQTILKSASNKTNLTSGAPVLVWIYGGGYIAGEKSAYSTFFWRPYLLSWTNNTDYDIVFQAPQA